MIHTLTLNPAIDRIIYLDEFKKNVTNRIQGVYNTIGGKGTHVSVALSVLEAPNTAFGISHGRDGQTVIDMLKESGVNVIFNHYDSTEKNTRTNYLIIEKSTDCTIVAEKGVILNDNEVNTIVDTMKSNIKDEDILILSGDASNSPDPSIYNRIMKELSNKNLKYILDTSGKSLCETMEAHPYMVKPNLDELSTLVGYEIPENDEDIIKAIDSLEKYNIPIIAVSLGGDGSITKMPDGYYRAFPAKVNVINTIGCGDTFLAGFVYGISEGLDSASIIRLATAVSCACAQSDRSCGFDRELSKELYDKVTVYKI